MVQKSSTRRRLVSISIAAVELGVCDKTIRRLISRGQLTGYRIGTRALRVDLNEVDGLAKPIPTAG